MRNSKVTTIQKKLLVKGYHLNKHWLRENENKILVSQDVLIPIVCNNCGHTREISVGTACDVRKKNPCPRCYQQQLIDKRFGVAHVKILDYKGVDKLSKLYCTHLGLEFERKISFMTRGDSSCICSSKHYTWKRIKELAAIRGYETLDNHEDRDIIGVKEKISLRCPKHGAFTMSLDNFSVGKGCSKCGHESAAQQLRMSKEEAQERIGRTHGARRYLIGDDYIGLRSRCTILCASCNRERFVTPQNVASGKRCPCETESKGESFTRSFLDYMELRYERQVRFTDCRNESPLPFDFKVYNSDDTWFLLEFDGIQHFKSVKYWGGKKGFKKTQERDAIKNQFCEENHIFLVRIQNKKDAFTIDDKERVVTALERAGAFMSFFSKVNRKHPWVIPVEI